MYSSLLMCSPALAMTSLFPMTLIHRVMTFSPLWEDTWMSTHPLLHLKLGGISGFPLPFLRQHISALWECTVPASWLMQQCASASCWSVRAVHWHTVVIRPYATARAVSVRSLSSMQRMVSAEPGDIGG